MPPLRSTEWLVTILIYSRSRVKIRPPIWRVAAIKLNKQSRTADKGWSPSWGLGGELTTPPRENPR